MTAVEEAIQAIREFPFWNYGMDDVDPTSEVAEWVPDLARAVLARVLAPDEATVERVAAGVHQAYLDTCKKLGWPVKPENRVPYADLGGDSKELDRASVRAVLVALAVDPAEVTA